VSTDRDRSLSEFVDAWNAGARPDVDDYVARVDEDERAELSAELAVLSRVAYQRP
jgi:chromosome segregation and condensation protein ScpB